MATAVAESNTTNLLQVRDLTVHYRAADGTWAAAVDAAGFDIEAGEGLGLLGESGSGKTTLALALLGLLPAAARVPHGSVRFRGVELLGLDEEGWQGIRGAEVALIRQEPGLALNPVLRVGQQVAEVMHSHRRWTWRRCREEAVSCLAEVGLPDPPRLFRAYPHELSGGQRQRVAIAQAIACRPALIIADEPTTALDSITQAEILALLRELKVRLGLSLLFITHSLGTLTGLADRVMVMHAGRIVEEGPLERICLDPLHPYTRDMLASLRRRTRGVKHG
jgi:ABC-type glutathione transport system ATPase component